MLVILANEQIISPRQVCQGCLLADQSGSPRWHDGRLCCGHSLGKPNENQPDLYQCQMGFKLAHVP